MSPLVTPVVKIGYPTAGDFTRVKVGQPRMSSDDEGGVGVFGVHHVDTVRSVYPFTMTRGSSGPKVPRESLWVAVKKTRVGHDVRSVKILVERKVPRLYCRSHVHRKTGVKSLY